MEEVLIDELLSKIIESQSAVDGFFAKKLDAGHRKILADPPALLQALQRLIKPSAEVRWTGSFVSISSQVRHGSAAPGENNSESVVMISICHVQMKQVLLCHFQRGKTPDFKNLKQAIKIIEAHRGRLEVESLRQTGCLLSVYLPLLKTEGDAPPVSPPKTEHILVVDDDPLQRSVIRRILARQGYSVETCPSGEDALRLLKEHPRDLIVLDMMLDGMTGTETYSRLLELQPSQKAIIVSGSCLTELIDQALQLGAGTFLSKPITPGDLTLAVRKELDRDRKSPGN